MTGRLPLADITLGDPFWLTPAVAVAAVALAMLAWAYWSAGSTTWVRTVAALLKAAGIVLLVICLVEPRFTGTRPQPGSNLMLVVADNSRSLQLSDGRSKQSRGAAMRQRLDEKSAWLTRLNQDFEVRRYAFDTSLRPLKDFAALEFDGQASAMSGSLASLGERFRGQAVAGILLVTDGNATDLASAKIDWKSLPPVYPVAVGVDEGLVDLTLSRVTVTQTNFEASPVTIVAEIAGQGIASRKVVLRVLDDAGKEVERRTIAKYEEGETLAERFLLKPEKPGVSFYTVQAALAGEEEYSDRPQRSVEATLANNRRLATVDRGGGPYRVLYVSGRPNWEFKFLRRAVEEDDEVQLVGLVRIARREPKFTFMSRTGERTNPLFRGFGNQGDEQAEQYDQPVIVRLGIEDKEELRGGFPKDSEDLFRYHAVVLDDLESAFFTQDQLSLLAEFVSKRGGGLLMLGGNDSLADGGYARNAVGDLLPIYLDRTTDVAPPGGYKLKLTREGWLQPWVRLRANEQDESARLAGMPGFRTVNAASAIKPGASVLAEIESADGSPRPALVVQPFGRGRTAALLVADLWRWNLRRTDNKESDLEKSWRQTVRWLVSDVPQPVEVETRPVSGGAMPGVTIVVRARDKQFAPLDNATVAVRVKTPDDRQVELVAESSQQAAGQYEAMFVPRAPGAYRADVVVTAADGSPVGEREVGWAVEPDTEEFQELAVNRALLERIAKDTGGEVIEPDGLSRFVASLPNRKIPKTETWSYPLWHQWTVLLMAIACLAGEWGLRRWKGLP